jgi:hypothetical protein
MARGSAAEVGAQAEMNLAAERAERLAFAQDFRGAIETLEKKLADHGVLTRADIAAVSSTMDEHRNQLHLASTAHAGHVETLASKLEQTAQELQLGFSKHLGPLEARLREDLGFNTMEQHVRRMIAEEAAARQSGLALHQGLIEGLGEALKAEQVQRRAGDDEAAQRHREAPWHGSATEMVATERAERLAGEKDFKAAIETLEKKLQDHGVLTGSDMEAVKAAMDEHKTTLHFATGAHSAKTDALAAQLEKTAIELEQGFTKHLGPLEARLREDLGVNAMEQHMRMLLQDEVKLVKKEIDGVVQRFEGNHNNLHQGVHSANQSIQALLNKHEAHKMSFENTSKAASLEIKAALDAQVEFAEALEREQRLLVGRVGEGLNQEDKRRDELASRVSSMELDMRKVRDHLPILFCKPSDFTRY